MSTNNDPARLVSDPGCPESQRALLRHGANIAPPRDAEARVWQALVGAIGAGALAGSADASTKTTTTTTTSATTTQVAGLTTAKIVALISTLAALVALGGYLVSSANDRRPPAAVAPSPAAEAPVTAPPAPPAAAATPPPADERSPAEAGMARPTSGTRRSVGAQPRHRVTTGPSTAALEQEREWLTIEALVKDGRSWEASLRATAFLRKYPDSPHAGEIRALGLGAPWSR